MSTNIHLVCAAGLSQSQQGSGNNDLILESVWTNKAKLIQQSLYWQFRLAAAPECPEEISQTIQQNYFIDSLENSIFG